MQNRAYSILTVKAVSEETRTIRGTATTPSPDRVGDVVEPLGVAFKNPMPLLWQHQADKPVGLVKFDKPTKGGITFEATLPKIEDAGTLKDRVDEAWQSVKAGLVAAVSIGFRAIEYSRMDDGGLRFLKSEVMELSLVTIPANADATITLVKSLDAESLAASGRDVSKATPAASGENRKPVVKRTKAMAHKKSLADKIAEWEQTKAAKIERMDEIQAAADDEGRTKDNAEREEYESLKAELDEIQKEIGDLRSRERMVVASAKAVDGSNSEKASESRGPITSQIKAPKPAAGLRFARYVRSVGIARKSGRDVMTVADELYGQRDPEFVGMVKAAVIAINTTTDAALIGNEGGWADFVEFLRPQTIIGKFGSNGIPSLRRVPFRVPLITQSGGGTGYWVGEGKGKPLTKPAFTRTELNPLKVANIAVATMEALRDSSPSAEMLLRDDLAAALVVRMDTSFINPANAGSAGVSPAGITNGLTAVVASGQDADAIRTDVRAAMTKFITANNPLQSGVWVMSATRALSLQMMVNPLGQPEFPGITMNGGTFMGLPVITSEHVTTYVALVNATDIYVADEGGIAVDMSTEASLEMMDNPTGDSIASTPVAAELVSMFQTNSVAFRAERTINWMRRRADGVALVTGVTWGDGAS